MKNTKMNKVLIALDHNPSAQKVAEVGFSLAKTMDAEIVLLNVFSPPFEYTPVTDSMMGFGGYTNTDIQQPDTKLLMKTGIDFLENIKNHLGDAKIKILVKEGAFFEAILETANLSKTDIIVIGSHSKKWLETILLGNTAKEILSHSNIPILIVPIEKKKG